MTMKKWPTQCINKKHSTETFQADLIKAGIVLRRIHFIKIIIYTSMLSIMKPIIGACVRFLLIYLLINFKNSNSKLYWGVKGTTPVYMTEKGIIYKYAFWEVNVYY